VTDPRADLARQLAGDVEAAEAELCRNLWFGDAERLLLDARNAFGRSMVERLGDEGPPAGGWEDPLVRALLLRDEGLGPDDVARLLDDLPPVPSGAAFAEALVAGRSAEPLVRALLAAGGGTGRRAAWFDEVFARFVLPQLTDGEVGHQAADDAFLQRFTTVCTRTARAAPDLFTSAWSFVGDVGVIAPPAAEVLAAREAPLPDSFSQPGLSGIVFFSPWVLDLPWHAEVTVLHEAVHQKLYTLLLTRPLFDRVVDEEATQVPVPWRGTSWPVRRAVSACHAYVHMSVALGALVRQAVEDGRPLLPDDGGADDPLVLLQVHIERMLHLAEQVARFDRSTLAEPGVDLVRWLRAVALDLGDSADRPNPGLGVRP
jgi:hypothetical protein